jgi:hypothetical protein
VATFCPFLCSLASKNLLSSLHVCFSVRAEGGSSGSGGEGSGKPEMNVSANLMLATTLMGALFVYQVCVTALCVPLTVAAPSVVLFGSSPLTNDFAGLLFSQHWNLYGQGVLCMDLFTPCLFSDCPLTAT